MNYINKNESPNLIIEIEPKIEQLQSVEVYIVGGATITKTTDQFDGGLIHLSLTEEELADLASEVEVSVRYITGLGMYQTPAIKGIITEEHLSSILEIPIGLIWFLKRVGEKQYFFASEHRSKLTLKDKVIIKPTKEDYLSEGYFPLIKTKDPEINQETHYIRPGYFFSKNTWIEKKEIIEKEIKEYE